MKNETSRIVVYDDIWNKVSNNIKKEFDIEPIYNNKFLETKIKSFCHEAIDFHDKKLPRVGSNFICLAVTLIDFLLKENENYFQQVLLKECKYIEKEKKVITDITDDLQFFSDSDEK